MKKIIVFGATGGTGKQIVAQALEAGHYVTVIVRNPDAFTLLHQNLKIIKGDVLQPETFAVAMLNKDVVISALGGGRSTKATTVYSVGIKNIIDSMQQQQTKRLLCISAGALYINKEMSFFVRLLAKYVLQKILQAPYADMRLMEKELQQSSLDYTIVRPAMLTNKKVTGKYRFSLTTPLAKPWSIARADVAHFMITHIDDANSFKTIAEIAY